MRFGLVLFSSVNAIEASVFSYSVFTHFVRPLHICMYSRCNDVVEELSLHFLLYRTISIALQFYITYVCKYKNKESKYK